MLETYIKDGNNANEYFIVDNGKIVLSYLKLEKDNDIYNVADDSLIAFLDNKYQAVKIYC